MRYLYLLHLLVSASVLRSPSHSLGEDEQVGVERGLDSLHTQAGLLPSSSSSFTWVLNCCRTPPPSLSSPHHPLLDHTVDLLLLPGDREWGQHDNTVLLDMKLEWSGEPSSMLKLAPAVDGADKVRFFKKSENEIKLDHFQLTHSISS